MSAPVNTTEIDAASSLPLPEALDVVGKSFTGVTATVVVTTVGLFPPSLSLTVNVTVRADEDGFSEVLLNVIARTKACTAAGVALEFKVINK